MYAQPNFLATASGIMLLYLFYKNIYAQYKNREDFLICKRFNCLLDISQTGSELGT